MTVLQRTSEGLLGYVERSLGVPARTSEGGHESGHVAVIDSGDRLGVPAATPKRVGIVHLSINAEPRTRVTAAGEEGLHGLNEPSLSRPSTLCRT
jgi:hypothetical protein